LASDRIDKIDSLWQVIKEHFARRRTCIGHEFEIVALALTRVGRCRAKGEIAMSRVLTTLIAINAICVSSSVVAAERNVLIVVADDLGCNLGCYGETSVQTPNMDQLAAEGTRFTRAYCTTASCSASRSVILTGLQNHANGQLGHAHNQFRTHDWVKGLPVLLSAKGYRTQLLGKLHVAPEEVYRFDEAPTEGLQGSRSPKGFADQARRFISEDDSRPFFIYAGSIDPHRDFGVGRVFDGESPVVYDPEKLQMPPYLPDFPECRSDLANYYRAVSRFDQVVGQLIEVLRQTNHLRDTLVVVLSDNGPPFPGAKTTMYEPGIRLPLIVRAPNQERRGIATRAMVTWADVTPTVLDFAGAAGPEYGLHGRSFLKVLGAESPSGWDEIYMSHTYHERQMYYPMRAVRAERYKLIYNIAHPLSFPFASDFYDSVAWQAVLKRGNKSYGRRSIDAYLHRPRFELYDLESDPDEIVNLAEQSEYSETLSNLQTKLRHWQQQSKDPWISKYVHE
jgi:N-sulfoglucosamine sulfohydrolase